MFLFVLGMTLVSAFNVIHLSFFGFEDQPSQWTMQPFFKDHAILGAILAITIPLCIGLKKLAGRDIVKSSSLILFFVILVFCLIVTYSRAAWVSVIPAILLYLIFLFRIRFRWLLMSFFFVLIYL